MIMNADVNINLKTGKCSVYGIDLDFHCSSTCLCVVWCMDSIF